MRTAGRAVIGGVTGLVTAIVALGPSLTPGSAAHLDVDGGVVQTFAFPGPGASTGPTATGGRTTHRVTANSSRTVTER